MDPKVTFFVGENGSGKSTLMEAIATNYGFSAEGGTKDHSFATYDSHSDMGNQLITVKEDYPKDTMFLRAESFYNVASYVKLSGGTRFGFIHERSHGEGFLETVEKLRPHGLYLFDEPESALSVNGQLKFLGHMKRLIDKRSQIIIATHSPIILGFGQGTIYKFSEEGIQKVDYHDTDPYVLTLSFLKQREIFAKELGLRDLKEK